MGNEEGEPLVPETLTLETVLRPLALCALLTCLGAYVASTPSTLSCVTLLMVVWHQSSVCGWPALMFLLVTFQIRTLQEQLENGPNTQLARLQQENSILRDALNQATSQVESK